MCGGIHLGVAGREECGLYVNGQVGQLKLEMLIDSGANISIIDYDIFAHLEPGSKPRLRRYAVPMVTADGTPMKVYGCAEFQLKVGTDSSMYLHKMCVADVGVDLILGYDFLKCHEAVLDLGQGSLTLLDAPTPGEMEDSEELPGECNVILGRTISVPAGGEAIAQGKCVGTEVDFVGVLEPSKRFYQKHCMLVASAVVTAGPKGVPVRLFNAGDTAVTVHKNAWVAKCTVGEVMETGVDGGGSRRDG
jgi:hypothetical protein